jgi:hypothetical protein
MEFSKKEVLMRFPVLLGAFVPLIFSFQVAVQAQNPNASVSFEVYPVIQSDVSPRLSALSQHVPPQALANMTRFLGHIDAEAPGNRPGGGGGGGGVPDPALQSAAGVAANYSVLKNITGVGVGFTGPAGSFTEQWAPPDTNMAVGPNHYVQWVNTSFAVFNKADDTVAAGPLPGNTPWADWNNGCATNNDGDPIVQYDRQNDRWIFTQFSISTKPYLQCFAISTGSDPQGPYFRFAINFGNSNFPDYPKMGIWPTGYFMSFNIFKGSFLGPKICAIDRAAAVAGSAPTVVCAQLGASTGSLLPADQDGLTDPSFPELFMGFSTNSLKVWSFTPNYGTPSSSTLIGPSTVSVKAFTTACGGGACIPQPNTSELLDSLADRLMYRLAYRNVGGTDYLVVNHSVNPNASGIGVSGIRWYQLTVTSGSGTVALVQQGTYGIDSNARWMGSIAMDSCGDIGVGYSVSGNGANNGVKPSIRFAGRVPGDAAGAGSLEQELNLVTGGGSQTSGLNRWGDYSAMRVDPTDDKTFYYTTEYLKNDGTFNWSTAISKIRFSASVCP